MKPEKILGCVCLGIILFVAIAVVIGMNIDKRMLNEFCDNNNYGRAIDSKSITIKESVVECSNNNIYNIIFTTNCECIEHDKWGECKKESCLDIYVEKLNTRKTKQLGEDKK